MPRPQLSGRIAKAIFARLAEEMLAHTTLFDDLADAHALEQHTRFYLTLQRLREEHLLTEDVVAALTDGDWKRAARLLGMDLGDE